MSDRAYTWRAVCWALGITLVWGGLCTRLITLHVGPNDEVRQRVANIRHVEQEIKVGRGSILDRKGNLLALDRAVANVCVDPKVICEAGHARTVAFYLARHLGLEFEPVLARVTRPRRRFEYIKKYVSEDTAEALRAYQLKGVFFEESAARYYPQGTLMAHVVGFSNRNGVGGAGIEQQLDRYLRGRSGLRVSEKDGRRRELYNRRSLEIHPQAGCNVVLTLDQNLQYMVEKALDAAMREHRTKGIWAIVQRVRTGEILALASRPTFDSNAYGRTPLDRMRNRAIGHVYEPGSTFKALVIAAALNEGLVQPDDRIDCEQGRWIYRGKPLRDYHAHSQLSVADVLKKSSNIGTAKIALQLGPERLITYLREFGVGRRTGIDLPGEERGILHDLSRWSSISITRIAMGHEVGLTALQMVNMLSAIANDGFLMRPYVVERVEDEEGRIIVRAQPEVVSRPLRSDTAQLMCRLLSRVTEQGGTATRACVEGYTVAGKTGTAQKPERGGYSSTKHMASFVGFLPAEDPEISIIVVADDPQPLHTGGLVAAPVFREIALHAVRYLDVAPPGGYTTRWFKDERLASSQ